MLFLKSKERRCLGLTSLLSVLAGVDVLIGDDVGLYLWSGRRIAVREDRLLGCDFDG